MESLIHQSSGWEADLSLGFQWIEGRTVLSHRQRRGPLAVQRPFYPEGGTCHVYVLHPPGGVVGGDTLAVTVELAPQAEVLVTTPGATKFYRSAGAVAKQIQTLSLSENACLEWFPQENIYFPGANVQMKTKVNVNSSSRLALWEFQCFGRPTINEIFDTGFVDSSLNITKEGRPIIIERLRFNDATKDRLSLMASMPVTATFVMNQFDESNLDPVRGLLPNEGSHEFSATVIDDFLVVRYLGDSTDFARKVFVSIWSSLRLHAFGKAATPPRIWNT